MFEITFGKVSGKFLLGILKEKAYFIDLGEEKFTR